MNSEKLYATTEKKERSSNFELLRIICMLLILAYHYCIHGNHHSIFKTDITVNQVISIIFGSWGLLGVDCFIFISAYFLIGSERFNTKKLLKLLLQTTFYSTVFAIVLIVSNKAKISSQDMLKSVFSPIYNLYWFVTAYCLLYVIYPFLNRIIYGIPAKNLGRLLLILTLFIPIYRTYISQAPIDAFLFFIYLYLIMGYLKQTPKNWFEVRAKKGFILTTLFIILYNIVVSAIGTYFNIPNMQAHAFRFATRYSPLMVLDAIFLFYVFKNLQIKASKIINTLASATLGIYLFHEYPFARPLLWDKLLRVKEVYSSNIFIMYLFLSVIGLYLLGTVIDLIRIHMFEKPLFHFKIKGIENVFSKLDTWINGN